MGADGGSIPRREELVRTRARDTSATAQDPALVLRAIWTLCALSRLPLAKPIVSDATGRMYNKEAVVRFLLGRADPDAGRDPVEEAVAGHLKGLKDLRELTLEPNPAYRRRSSPGSSSSSSGSGGGADSKSTATVGSEDTLAPYPYICALTQKELNGKARFVYLRSCGCVLAESGLRTVAAATASGKGKGKGHKGAEGRGAEGGAAASKLGQYECPLCSKPFRAAPAFFSSSGKLVAGAKTGAAAGAASAGGEVAEGAAADVELALLRYDPQGDVVPLNPPLAEQEALRAALLANRASSSSKKRKAAAAGTTDGDSTGASQVAGGGAEAADVDEKARKKAEARAARQAAIAKLSAELAADGSAAPAGVAAKGAASAATQPAAKRARVDSGSAAATAAAKPEEKKEMSAALRSIYGLDRPKDPKGESWMVRGTFNRYA